MQCKQKMDMEASDQYMAGPNAISLPTYAYPSSRRRACLGEGIPLTNAVASAFHHALGRAISMIILSVAVYLSGVCLFHTSFTTPPGVRGFSMQSIQAVTPVRYGGTRIDRTQEDANHKIRPSNAIESNLAPVAETRVICPEPCDSSKIIATSGNCLMTNYSSPLYYGDRSNLAFTRDLYLALCQLSETNRYRRRLYGDEADESRFNHTPPETRARYVEVLRRDSVHSETASAKNTPQFEREMSKCSIGDASSQSTGSTWQEPVSTLSQNCQSLSGEGKTVHECGRRDSASENTAQPSVGSFTQSQW